MALIDKFGGNGAEQYNALHTALVRCAEDAGYEGEYREYEWIEATPRTSMVCLLVDKLNELGFQIIKGVTE